MKKKLTRASFSALRETATVLDEQQQRAIKGGDYWSDHGYWSSDSNGNSVWTRTYGTDNSSPGSSSSSDYGSGSSGLEGTISQSEYFNWTGRWPGGYVEGLGYVTADAEVYGVNGVSSTSYEGYSTSHTSYHSSSGDFSRSNITKWFDLAADVATGELPIMGALSTIQTTRLNNLRFDALGALLDQGYNGSVIVEVTVGDPNSNTSAALNLKVYSGGGTLLFDSN